VNALLTAGGLLGTAGLAVLIVAPRRELRLAGLVAWGVGLTLIALDLAPDVSPALLGAAGLAGLVVAIGGAALLLRWPYLLPFATVACVAARIPVEVGGEEANLLLPLYAVVASAAVALAWQLAVRRDRRHRELGPVTLPLAAFVLWTGVSVVWTVDEREAAIALGAFVLPFGLLAVALSRLPWRGRLLTWLWGLLVGTALLYASIGVYQWATREVFWNPKVIVGNAYAPFFRVNSVFWDPSIYGRYLVVGILTALAGVLLGGVRGRKVAGLVLVIWAMWVGLVLSFSQTSFVALSVGVTAAALVVWGRRALVAAVVVALVVGAATFATPQVRERVLDEGRTGIDKVTSGRSNLVGEGVRIAVDNPVGGVGVGSFKAVFSERTGLVGRATKRGASHTTPITVAAETGVVGLVLYLWLLVAALRAALTGLGTGFTSRVSFAVGLTLLAIVTHSVFYAGFFEDPLTWAVLGLVGLASTVPRRPAAAPVSAMGAAPDASPPVPDDPVEAAT
jgi:O-antigen ligase